MKKSLIITLIVIVVLAILIIAGFFACKYSCQIIGYKYGGSCGTPPPETAGWKIYTNNVAGFSIKYPGTSSEPPYAQNMDGKDDVENVYFKDQALFISNLKRIEERGDGSKVLVFGPDGAASIQQTEQCTPTNEEMSKNVITQKNGYLLKDIKKISGVDFYHYISTGCAKSGGCMYEDVFRVLHGTDCYEITLLRQYSQGDSQTLSSFKNIPDVINQMLSTFKFTK